MLKVILFYIQYKGQSFNDNKGVCSAYQHLLYNSLLAWHEFNCWQSTDFFLHYGQKKMTHYANNIKKNFVEVDHHENMPI